MPSTSNGYWGELILGAFAMGTYRWRWSLVRLRSQSPFPTIRAQKSASSPVSSYRERTSAPISIDLADGL